MKKIFYSIILSLGILLINQNISLAQSCNLIDSDSAYEVCCVPYENTVHPNMGACSAYVSGPRCAQVKNSADYAMCCSSPTSPATNRNACLSYNAGSAGTSNTSCDRIENDLDYARCCASYTPDNAALCTGYIGIIDFNDGVPPDGSGVGRPRGQNGVDNSRITGSDYSRGAAALDQCSEIKFISILNILIWAKCILNSFVIPLIFTLAFVFFLWNIAVFIRKADNQQIKEEAKQRMMWGIIALFIMVSVWGIISIATNIFEINPTVPMLQTEYLNPENADK